MEIVITLIIGAVAGWLGSTIYKCSGLGIIGNLVSVVTLNNTSLMTGDFHVRFCERLRSETPICLLSGLK
jgi:uncharacterized membrane protein YeaQ/YmgE (transglycosylase-associated protein family)